MAHTSSDNATAAAVSHLRTLRAVRSTTAALLASPQHLQHFDLHIERLDDVANQIVALIARDYASPTSVPAHARWRHFEISPPGSASKTTPRIDALIDQWTRSGMPAAEITRRLLDLFTVSVLLDAGAGDAWTYKGPAAAGFPAGCGRSEGLALASLDWFLAGGFSSDPTDPARVDADGLLAITPAALRRALQVDDAANPLVGVDGRCGLLQRLGAVCKQHPRFFGEAAAAPARPGNMLDFLLAHPSTELKPADAVTAAAAAPHVRIEALWEVIVDGIAGIWPATRTKLGGVALGDVWPCSAKARAVAAAGVEPAAAPGSDLVAFHKLSQWLTYSLMEPMERIANVRFLKTELMTGLAEYRNGGLFVDAGVIVLRDASRAASANKAPNSVPRFNVFDDVVVEWRALTVGLLDRVGALVRAKYGLTESELPLVKVLEAGTWKLGRELAAAKRPQTKGPPIEIISDGTVF
ncbi:hypothetical protein DFJ73DRAFT_795502 [Zopfochytrium polystomum]|nr:hypothetical protein DFJ73DRAFT_795502 [Zopfochytrium polystomum]